MTICKNNSSFSSGALLILSFFALLGFLKPFNSLWAIVWEVCFALVSIGTMMCCNSSAKKMFKLSLFYATNIVLMLIFNFNNKSETSFAFFVIGIILMSLGFVIAINNIHTEKKPLVKKSIKELRKEVDEAFDNVAAADVQVEKYYHENKNAEKVVPAKAKAKKPKKKASKKKSRR